MNCHLLKMIDIDMKVSIDANPIIWPGPLEVDFKWLVNGVSMTLWIINGTFETLQVETEKW